MPQALCPIIVGRDDELTVLEERLSAAREGSGSLVFLVGEAGIGKSRLAREVTDRARDAGMETLQGRNVQAETQVPLRSLTEALQGALIGVLPKRDDLRPYRPALARLVPGWGQDEADDPSSEASPILLREALIKILSVLASPGGLLLVLEDLHWADADTLGAVEYLADHIGSEPVLCVATLRSDEPGAGGALARTLTARRAATTVTLDRLPGELIEEMIRATAREKTPPADVIAAVRSRAEGVPFVVEEMLSGYLGARTMPPGWEEVLPPSYRDLVRGRLERVSPEARRVVLAAAVLGRSFEWELLAEITGFGQEETLARLREAVEAQLVDTGGMGIGVWFRFRHALVREAVLGELLPPERADLALRAAGVIEARFPGVPGEWCERAADLREQGGDRRGAARLLLESGRRAMARWALAGAERILEHARELAGPADPWMAAGIGHTLLETLALAGRMDRVRQVGEEVLDHFDGARRTFLGTWWMARLAPVLLDIARGAAAAGDPELARTYLDRAQDLRDRIRDEVLLARMSALAGQVALMEGDLEAAVGSAETALEAGNRLEQAEVSCEALDALGWVALRRGEPGAAADTFQRLLDVARDRGFLLWEVRALLGAGVIDRCTGAGVEKLLAAQSIAGPTDAASTKAWIELELGRSFLERFELVAAATHLDACLDACRRYGLPLLPQALVTRAALSALRSDPAAARSDLGEAEDLSDHTAVVSGAAAARVLGSLVAGDRDEAVRHLDRAAEVLLAAPPSEPRSLPGLWAAVHADEEEPRRKVAASPHGACRAAEGYLALAEAASLGASGRSREAVERVRHADRSMSAFPWHRHLGRLLAAERSAAAGWGEPATWARESLAFFDLAGHRSLADAAKRVLRHLGEPVPRRGRGDSKVPSRLRAMGVTSREMDVLTLVARGLTNAKIAQRLYLSRRTVETHVSSLMRKSGTQSREELGAILEAEARAGR